jgi:hypothetical protein
MRYGCITTFAQLARSSILRLNAAMRGGAVAILLGITAFVAYSLGHQNAPVNYQPAALTSVPAIAAKPVAFAPAPQAPLAMATPTSATAVSPDTSARPENRRKVEAVLTTAAIAAIIVQTSRDQYHAGGRPCACPDDSMRNGRACGGRSAYSRPGGAAPLCYPSDVSAAMVESYKQRTAAR